MQCPLRNKKKYFFILSIVLLSYTLSIFKVTEIPPGFFCDEAAIGYNAYKLLTTGRDEYGISWPIFFRSFGDYRTPIPIYSNIISTALFGLSEFSVRFTSAFYGTLTVLVMYYLGEILGGPLVGFISSFFLATSPWYLQMSRWGSEYIYFPFFIAFGLYLFIKAYSNKPNILPFSFMIFALGLYTYYPTWIVTPLMILMVTILWFWKRRFSYFKIMILSYLVFFLIAAPLIKGIKEGYVLARWRTITQINNTSISENITQYAKFYADHFFSGFLFFYGDFGYPGHFITRHSVPDMGELYRYQLPLFIIGLLAVLLLILRRGRGILLLVLFLLLIYPLGSTLTLEGPFATRSIIGILPVILIVSFGVKGVYNLFHSSYLRKYIIISLLIGMVVISFRDYLWNYYFDYAIKSADFYGWQYGPKQIINYLMSVESNYDELYNVGEVNAPQIFLPFYTIDGKKGCRKCRLGSIANFDSSKKQLFIVNPGSLNIWLRIRKDTGYKIVKVFYYPNGEVSSLAVELFENTK